MPMKNIDTLKQRSLKPKKQTVKTLLDFSRSVEVIQTKQKNFLISKN